MASERARVMVSSEEEGGGRSDGAREDLRREGVGSPMPEGRGPGMPDRRGREGVEWDMLNECLREGRE